MLISMNWIREYVSLPDHLTMDKLAHDLTLRTVEIEGAKNPAEALEHIVVGRILRVAPHPAADRLRLATTEVGLEHPVQIVCGGINLRPEQKVVVALPGAKVRWHGEGAPVVIQPGKLRGEASYGMICGSDEVGLEELFPAKQEGEIMDLSSLDVPAGMPLGDALGLNDVILEVDNKSMTHRPDLWGHYGLARELSAIYHAPLALLPAFEAPKEVLLRPIEVEDAADCPRYTLTQVDQVSVAPSPLWLQIRLFSVGVRPINNVVDLTNYAMLTTGEPCHAFDADSLTGGLCIRRAQNDEELVLLDGSQVSLTREDLVIADEKGAVALAGVMGGKADSVHPKTGTILLEAASFDPSLIRRTTKKHALRTEASMRFEKGLNTQRVEETLGVFQAMARTLLPGCVFTSYQDVAQAATPTPSVRVTQDFLSRRLGRELSLQDLMQSLSPLGFQVAKMEDAFDVRVPAWRATGDVSLPEDLLEEVARMIGYENFSFQAPQVELTGPVRADDARLDRRIREYLAFRCGLQEIYTYPWVHDQYIKAAQLPTDHLCTLAAPPSPEHAHLRSSLVPGLLEACDKNSRYFEELAIFEVTQVFRSDECYSPSVPEERLPKPEKHLGIALMGPDPEALFWRLKGIVEDLPRIAMLPPFTFTPYERPPYADRNAWLNVHTQGVPIGDLSLVSLQTLNASGIKHAALAIAQINLSALKAFPSRDNHFIPLPNFPLVLQDLSLLVEESVQWADLKALVAPKVRSVEFIDEYRGSQIPQGKKSVTLRVWLGSDEKTLTSKEIDAVMQDITQTIADRMGAHLRDQ
ncbi:Phenylalanyl-tRNA synthetase beta chain [Clostridiaceae bacterium JG1575]|nr:Phenylalanyl-tRNA synthetase beta chain [Clostridiaceae bacterium JG1575]